MSPVLRGEALPLPAREIAELRDGLGRDYADAVVPTSAGPYLVVRVPHREPDFLRDLEAAVDVMPYRDLKGFRGVLLVGDRAHMGVSTDMLRALLDGREQAERDWVNHQRRVLEPWRFVVGRLPADPQRRMRAVFRVQVDSVEQLDEADFARLADVLPAVKAASPGQMRPYKAYLVAELDHVALDGATFFTELERRRRRMHEREERERRQQLEDRHELAVAHLERILGERKSRAPAPRDAPFPPPPVPVARQRAMPPVDVVRTAPVRPEPARPDPFAAAARHQEAVATIRSALTAAGYKVKERLLVREQPVVLAGARLSGYPTRVLVTFLECVTPDDARRLIQTGRGVDAELILCVADAVAEGTERVTLATNLKVVSPADVPDLRFG